MKNLVALVLLIFSTSFCFSQDRNITLPYGSDSIVYARDGVFFFNEETKPLTAKVTTLHRLTNALWQTSEYKNGNKIAVDAFDENEKIKLRITYWPPVWPITSEIRKSLTHYNTDGSIKKHYDFNKDGDRIL